MLEVLLVSTLVVAVGELGDKTQIAIAMLAAKFDTSVAVVAGLGVRVLAGQRFASQAHVGRYNQWLAKCGGRAPHPNPSSNEAVHPEGHRSRRAIRVGRGRRLSRG